MVLARTIATGGSALVGREPTFAEWAVPGRRETSTTSRSARSGVMIGVDVVGSVSVVTARIRPCVIRQHWPIW